MKNKNVSIGKNYHDHAVEYDQLSREAVPWLFFDKPFVEKKILPVLKNKMKLLDLGCGGGKVIEILTKKGFLEKNIFGVDISKGLVELAKKNHPAAEFRVGDFTKIKFPQEEFDVAVSVRSVEYLSVQELETVFKKVYSALKKGGKFFLLTGHPLRVNDGSISTYLERGKRTVSLPWDMKVDLFHKTLSDFIMAAVRAGFVIELIDEPALPLSLKKKNPEKFEHYQSFGAVNLFLILVK